MELTLNLPDETAQWYSVKNEDLARCVLEAFALQCYRSGDLTSAQVRKLLGFETRMELDGFLKKAGVLLDYSQKDLDRDLDNLRDLPELATA